AAKDTAMNPAVVDAFALVVRGVRGQPAYPGVPGHEPDAAVAQSQAQATDRAMNEIRKLLPRVGSYVWETDFFQPNWQDAFWGENYPRLRAVKDKYDRHAASRLATPFLLASGRAPEHQGAVFNSSAVLPQAPRSPPTLAGSAAKKLSVFIPAANYPRHQTPKSHQRLVRDPKIPIGRAQPSSALPTRSFLLGRLSNAGPTTRTTVQKGP